MNMAPMSDPKMMIPAVAATQKMRLPATARSYRGDLARRCRMKNTIVAATASARRPAAAADAAGTGAKLMLRTSAATITTERIPPRLSTGAVVSFTCPGT
jgi:hypothetical protein